MYSYEINHMLKHHAEFWGCYDIESLPQVTMFKGWLIIHCKEHWVGVYSFADGKNVLLFDPLGPNEKQQDVTKALQRNGGVKRVVYNTVKVQSDQSLQCGLFCIGFVLAKINSLSSFDQFLSVFSTCDLDWNEKVIYCLVNLLKKRSINLSM